MKKKNQAGQAIMPGYRDMVTLVSPQGEKVTIHVPGRIRGPYREDGSWCGGAERVLPLSAAYTNPVEKAKLKRQERHFQRLLSQGWQVLRPGVEQKLAPEEDGAAAEEEKKNTDIVLGTTKEGNQSHGGDHASCEVKDSPNHAKRGCRGGRGKKRKEEKRQNKKEKSAPIKMMKCAQSGGGNVYCPQPFKTSPKMAASAEKSARLLAELVGRSQQKFYQGVQVKAQDLLVALETGDNPIPPLEAPRERPRMRVLVTPDCSGSCQNWSGLGRAWATYLSRLPDTDILYVENSNGELINRRTGSSLGANILPKVDVLIYLGDGDGYSMCQEYPSKLGGATVIALDCTSARVAKPRLNPKPEGVKGDLFWIDRVSAHDPETWYQGLCLALGRNP